MKPIGGTRDQKRERVDHEKLHPSVVFASMPPFQGVSALIPHMLTEQVDSKVGRLEMMKEPGREQSTLPRQESTASLHDLTSRSGSRWILLARKTRQQCGKKRGPTT